ncbi:histidine kinase [Corynebacterium variabile]|uniref:histidine kinase n=1 Tax=Corynebacterium variabile TaxID=1727 RepID=UPI00289E6C7E|nr:histidine kinase [Corynebacterium variabile]
MPTPATRRFDTTSSLLASVWLIILLIPAVLLIVGDAETWRKTAGTALFAAFAAVYAVAFGVLGHSPARLTPRGRFLFWLAPLAMLAVATGAVVGVAAGYLVPFLVAYFAFLLPPARSIGPVVLLVVASSWAVFLSDDPAWIGHLGGTLASPVFVYLIALASHRAEREQNLAHELAQTRQRESVAVDVHDLLGHSLTVVTLKAELASRLVDTDPDAAKDELAQIARISRTSLAEVRATVTRLRQPDLTGEIEGARRALQTAGIAASLPTDARVAGPNARLFSWVVREAVTNVVRHSGATRCTVELGADRVRITDDGDGFGVGSGGAEGNGLSGLRGRVEDAGGRLTVTGSTDGTEVLVTMAGTTVGTQTGEDA